MKVLHLDGGRDWRGGQIQTATLLDGLVQHKVDQELLARAAGFERFRPGTFSAASILAKARSADLVHAHDARSHSLAALLCPGIPLVVSRRVAFAVRSGWTHRWKYRRPSLYLAVSDYVAGELRRIGVNEERIRVVHDGLRPPAVQEAAPVDPGSGVVAIRSSDPGKGSALATEACRRAGLELLLSNDLARDLPDAGIFLYLSEMEGLGSGLILAGFHGKPIVASRIGGIPEVVADGETGLLTSNDPDAVAACLRRLVGAPDLAAACGRAAQRQAHEKFTDGRMVEQTLTAYHEVLRRVGKAS